MIKSKLSLLALLLLGCLSMQGQSTQELKLVEAYKLLEERYPSLKDGDLLLLLNKKELELLEIEKLPTIDLKVEGRIQTESVQLESDNEMIPISINQPIWSVKPYVEASYNLIDGGVNKAKQKVIDHNYKVEQQHLEITRYNLRAQINRLFLNITFLREQEKLFELSIKDLEARKSQIEAGVEYGTVLESELIKIEVRQLELAAQKENINFQIGGALKSLSDLIDLPLSNEVQLDYPTLSAPTQIPAINRPELAYFKFQEEAILAQSDLIDAQRRPKLNAFAQAGVGYPNPLNLLDSGVAPYGLLGLGFSWSITDWKKQEREKEKLSLNAQRIQHAAASFEFNLDNQTANYRSEVSRLQYQIEQDKKIAQLQADILQQLAAQLDEGVITSTDYLLQLNTELKARQNIAIHEIELLQLQINFWNERGGI